MKSSTLSIDKRAPHTRKRAAKILGDHPWFRDADVSHIGSKRNGKEFDLSLQFARKVGDRAVTWRVASARLHGGSYQNRGQGVAMLLELRDTVAPLFRALNVEGMPYQSRHTLAESMLAVVEARTFQLAAYHLGPASEFDMGDPSENDLTCFWLNRDHSPLYRILRAD